MPLNMEMVRGGPNTFIPYFSAYILYIIFITPKLWAAAKKRTSDSESASKITLKKN